MWLAEDTPDYGPKNRSSPGATRRARGAGVDTTWSLKEKYLANYITAGLNITGSKWACYTINISMINRLIAPTHGEKNF